MLQRKVCMLGGFAVGKTSLVRRYVDSMFSEKYTTTIGVKIDKKVVSIGEHDLSLLLWDVYGEDNHQTVLPAYLRGMAGYLLVVDPTRAKSFESAVLVLNKSDLKDEWEELPDTVSALQDEAVAIMETSAKTDSGVNEMFESLASAMLPLPTG